MKKIKAGIIGGAGYTGGELIRLLINHPDVDIIFVQSRSNSDKFIYEVHSDLLGDTELKFSQDADEEVDVLFLCVGHGEARAFMDKSTLDPQTRVIDLSQDFRLENTNQLRGRKFIYGLSEWNKPAIASAMNIANPGCFATCIQLALLPLASGQLLKSEVHVSATTGSTGAGQSLSETSHFSWRHSNLSSYKAFEHQHLKEIGQSVAQQQNFEHDICFVPLRGNFTRGIFASLYTDCDLELNAALALYKATYAGSGFVHISHEAIDLKQVVNTNKCLLHLEKHGSKLLITGIIDNLLKGASGQAVQNMNLMFGLEETSGLKLKATAF